MELFNPSPTFQGYGVGNWIQPLEGPVSSGSTATANIIFFTPFILKRGIGVSELGARVSTAVASSTFQLAIYASDQNLVPAGLPLGSTTDLSAAAATTVSGSVTPFNMEANRIFWMASNVTSSGSVIFQTLSQAAGIGNSLIGADTLANASSGGSTASWIRQFNQTYGTWPNMTSQNTSLVASGYRGAMIFLRVSSLL